MSGKALTDYCWSKHTINEFHKRVLKVVQEKVDPYAKHVDDVVLNGEYADVYKDNGDMIVLPRYELENIEW